MFKNLITLSLICMLMLPVRAQHEPESGYLKHEIGLAAGFSTGYGISYRYWPGKLGFQITSTPNIEKESAMISTGITGLIKFAEIDWLRVFGYVGNHLLYEYSKYSQYDPFGNPTGQTETNRQYRYILGIGPGFEFFLGRKFGLNLMFGFRSDWYSSGNYILTFTGESGLYYRF